MARVEAEAEMEQGGDDRIQGTSGALESLNRAPFCAKGGCAQDKCLGDML